MKLKFIVYRRHSNSHKNPKIKNPMPPHPDPIVLIPVMPTDYEAGY